MSDALVIDINDLTIEEIEVIEDYTDLAIDEAFKPGAKRGKLLRALAFVSMRRKDPNATWEDAGRQRVVLSESEDPTSASAS